MILKSLRVTIWLQCMNETKWSTVLQNYVSWSQITFSSNLELDLAFNDVKPKKKYFVFD